MSKNVSPVPTMRFNVTQTMINKAVPNSKAACLIGQGLRGGDCWSVRVTADFIAFNRNGMRYCFKTPAPLAATAITFDKTGNRPDPFGFTLHSRDGFSKPIEIRAPRMSAKSTRNRKTKKIKPRSASCGIRRFHGATVIAVRDQMKHRARSRAAARAA